MIKPIGFDVAKPIQKNSCVNSHAVKSGTIKAKIIETLFKLESIICI